MYHLRVALAIWLLMPSALVAQTGLRVSAGGGFTLPRGDVTAEHGAGLNFAARTTYPLGSHLAVRGGLDYRELRRKDDPAIRSLGHDPDEFRVGGGILDGHHRRTLAGLGHLVLLMSPRNATARFYLFGGGGIARTEIGDLGFYFLGYRDSHPGESEWAPAADVGGGLQVVLVPAVQLFAEASYLTFFDAHGSTSMVPVQIGLSVDPAGLRR